MTDSIIWSEACEEAWLAAHNYANEKNCAGTLASLLTLFVALQHDTKDTTENLVLKVYLKLRQNDSPIYLLARKPTHKSERFYFPIVEHDKIKYKPVENQLFVQLETSAMHDEIVKEEWKDNETHHVALCSAGFYLPSTTVTHGKVL